VSRADRRRKRNSCTLSPVFVDTATLYPVSLADLVLRLAELGMFEFDLLDEGGDGDLR